MRPGIREKHDGDLADRSSIRLWLRLLSCATVMEKRLKRRLSDRFDSTLPRFDVLAALDRAPDGLTMGALSGALLVSNGNVTGVVQGLIREGHVTLCPSPTDRRASIAQLTPGGAAHFATLADAHHHWVEAMVAGMTREDRQALYTLLGALKQSLAADSGEVDP